MMNSFEGLGNEFEWDVITSVDTNSTDVLEATLTKNGHTAIAPQNV
jgi:hypothetical protein